MLKINAPAVAIFNEVFGQANWSAVPGSNEYAWALMEAAASVPGLEGAMYTRLLALVSDISLNAELVEADAGELQQHAEDIMAKAKMGKFTNADWASSASRRINAATVRILSAQDEAQRLLGWIKAL